MRKLLVHGLGGPPYKARSLKKVRGPGLLLVMGGKKLYHGRMVDLGGIRRRNQPLMLRLAQVVPTTEAEGPGKRFAIWFQGCPLRCPGCCNPEMLPFEGGVTTTLEALLERIDLAAAAGIEGITLLGGEPFAHAVGASMLAREVQRRGLSVMVFSGYTLQQLRVMDDRYVTELLSHADILVDGPYLQDQPESERRWIGSSNQRIHFLSTRYSLDDPCWRQPNTLEIRLADGELSINGFPAVSAVSLWSTRRSAW